jgi:hypothetical protein
MSRRAFPWYDARWLTRFACARQYMARHRPDRLASFMSALEPLRTRADFETCFLDSMLSRSQVAQIEAAFHSVRQEQLELHELSSHGRFVVHDHPMLAQTHLEAAEQVSRLAGERVEPYYSFLGLYTQKGRCDVHLDAPDSKWTLDYCIEQSAPWPISFSNVVAWPEPGDFEDPDWEQRIKRSPALRFTSVAMEPGQAVFFSGSSQWHYREPVAAPRVTDHWSLLFLHFIPAGMKEVAEWRNWESMFAVPGLGEALKASTAVSEPIS